MGGCVAAMLPRPRGSRLAKLAPHHEGYFELGVSTALMVRCASSAPRTTRAWHYFTPNRSKIAFGIRAAPPVVLIATTTTVARVKTT